MKAENYREMSPDELQENLANLQKRLFHLRAQAVTETLENNKIIRNTKKEIARIRTIMNEREK